MARLLMKNASHIVTCDPSDTVYTDSNLLMEDGVITYIGPEEQQAEEVQETHEELLTKISDTKENLMDLPSTAKEKIASTAASAREKLSESAENINVKEKIAAYKETREAARLEKQHEKEELERRYKELFAEKNFGFKRLMKAFPDMTSREQNESLEKYKKYFNIRKPDHKKDE